MKANKTRELAKYNCSMCGRAQEIMDKGICAPSCVQEFKLSEEIDIELTNIETLAEWRNKSIDKLKFLIAYGESQWDGQPINKGMLEGLKEALRIMEGE